LTENVLGTTKTKVTTSGSPSMVTQPVTFTASVKSRFGAIPDGDLVTFADKNAVLGSAPITGGVAAYTTSVLARGVHPIRATYNGDATFAASTRTVKQTVDGFSTHTMLTSSPNPSNHMQAVIFTATVTSAGPPPT